MQKSRNYQLDFLKLVFALLVVISHTGIFVGKNTRLVISDSLGWMCVHFFFVVSGMLMVNSFMKKRNDSREIRSDYGKRSLIFVVNKFKNIALIFWVALAIRLVVHILVYDYTQTHIYLLRSVMEIFAVNASGISGGNAINGPAWYISAMLVAMLPLYYMLQKNEDFFLYVFSPLGALLSLAYMINQPRLLIVTVYSYHGFVIGGLIRAFCGLCFGTVAWLIADWLSRSIKDKPEYNILMSVIETVCYVLYIWVSLTPNLWWICHVCVIILLPIALAITLSQKDVGNVLAGEGAGCQWMSFLAPLSLTIFLNHDSAIRIVEHWFPGKSYKLSIVILAGFIVVICVLHCFLIKMIGMIRKNSSKLRKGGM